MSQADTTPRASVFPLFAVPIMQCMVPGAEQLNRDLVSLVLRLEAEGERHRDTTHRDTQHGIFESNFQFHRRPEPEAALLFRHINSALAGFIRGLNNYSEAQMARIAVDMHAWFHVTRNGGFQGTHNHPNASWSAIYCVDPGDASSPMSGAVRFHDPRGSANMYRDPANTNLQTPYQIGPWQLTHKPGQLLIFPSYITHEIFPYMGVRPRIVIALNAWFRWNETPPR